MNKLDRIKNLENEMAELKAEIVEEEKVKDWNPKTGEYSLNYNGKVVDTVLSDEKAKNYGVEFDMKQQAQQAAIAYRRYHRLYRLALELNDGWVPDFGRELKSCIYIINGDLIVDTNKVSYSKVEIYFKTKKLAQKAIDILGDELL